MVSEFFCSSSDYTSAEIKGIKASRSERESYGDNAIGYVQLKREGDICTVKARITPEHNVRSKSYSVNAVCNEAQEKILSVECEDCAAHQGGCKHSIAFLAWLHRRSEDPSTTSINCYWKRSKMSTIGSSLKFMKVKDMYKQPTVVTPQTSNILEAVITNCKKNKSIDTQLTKYYKDYSPIEQLSMHILLNSTNATNLTDAEEFIAYCKNAMNSEACEKARLATKQQQLCPLWHELRYARITASKISDAYCKKYDGTLVEQIIGSSKLKGNDAMQRGRNLEKFVRKEVEKRTGIRFYDGGFILNKDYPVMEATTDGISTDYCIEIKCPLTEKSMKKYLYHKRK